MLIHICNNDQNGNWSRSFSRVEFWIQNEVALRLETKTMFHVTAEVFDVSMAVQQMKIYGVTVKCSLRGTWTGSMRWNTIEMLDYYALGFLRALQLSGEWDVDEAWVNIFDKFRSGEEITGLDFELDEDIQPRVVHPNQLQIQF